MSLGWNFDIHFWGKNERNADSSCRSNCWNYIIPIQVTENAPYKHQIQFTATSSPVNSQRHYRSEFSTMESASAGNAGNILYASLICQGRIAVCGNTVGCKPTWRSFMSRGSYTWQGASVINMSCFYMLLEFAVSLKGIKSGQVIQNILDRWMKWKKVMK